MSRSDQTRVETLERKHGCRVIEGEGRKKEITKQGWDSVAFRVTQIRLHRVVKPRKTFPMFFE